MDVDGAQSKAPPSIDDEAKYVGWFIRNSDKIAHLRFLFDTDGFVDTCTKGAMNLLEEYPTSASLFDRVGDLAVAYETRLKPFVEKEGGLENCSVKMQGAVASLLVNIAVGQEFLVKKYKNQEAIDLFAIADDQERSSQPELTQPQEDIPGPQIRKSFFSIFNRKGEFISNVTKLLPSLGLDLSTKSISSLRPIIEQARQGNQNEYEAAVLAAFYLIRIGVDHDIKTALLIYSKATKKLSIWKSKGLVRGAVIGNIEETIGKMLREKGGEYFQNN